MASSRSTSRGSSTRANASSSGTSTRSARHPNRPDRLLKTRELTTLLEFYLERGLRYGLMDPDAAQEARTFLDLLEDGYTLRFSRSGVVFDFDKPGTEPAEHEVGIEFHRVGIDLIHNLMSDAAPVALGASSTDTGNDDGDGSGDGEMAHEAASPLPRLDAAAFLVAERARSTTDRAVNLGHAEIPKLWGSGVRGHRAPPMSLLFRWMRHHPDSARWSLRPQLNCRRPRAPPRVMSNDLVESEPVELTVPSQPKPVAERALPVQEIERPQGGSELAYDSILGVTSTSPQYGLLGEASGRKIALDLNQTHTISLFGVQGGGKSYTLGSVVEMALHARWRSQYASAPAWWRHLPLQLDVRLPAGIHVDGGAKQRR